MNNKIVKLKEKIITTIKKYSGFELIVDMIQRIVDLQILYCALLFCYFNAYQHQKAAFQPILYFTLVVYAAFIFLLEKFGSFTELWTIMISELITGLLYVFALPLSGPKVWLGAAVFILIADSVWRHRFSFSETLAYSVRYRYMNRGFLKGAIIVILFFIHVLSSEMSKFDAQINPKICSYYMIFSFAIFIIFTIILKYAFYMYDYYRHGRQADLRSRIQARHSFLLVLFVLSVVVAIAFLFFGALLTPLIEWLFKVVSSFLLEFIFWKKFDSKSKDAASSDQGMGDYINSISADRATREKSPVFEMVPYLVSVILIVAAIYLLWKLYKNILANYKIGSDEAEFIEIREEKELYVEKNSHKIKQIFGKTNKEKIRKYYYAIVAKRARQKKIVIEKENTPKELAAVLSNTQENSLHELTDIYERARYSNKKCLDQEVEKVKRIYEKL